MIPAIPGIRIQSPETLIAMAVVLLALVLAYANFRWVGFWERPLARLAHRKYMGILIATAIPLVLRALLLPWFPMPEPRVHDEFSFILGADTLLQGRLANPVHPFWMHFESVHILARPSYATAFPLAQSAALAAGELLGHWWLGVWLTSGIMCGAICWMLEGWVPRRWALLGALLVALRIGVPSYWMNTYWGGSVAALGGTLVLGALPRIKRAPHWRHAIVMGVGLAILANSRAFEGAVFGLVIAVPLLSWVLTTRGPQLRSALLQIVLPLAVILALTGAGLGYYFARVTGKPWVAPYVLYRNTASIAPHFLWDKPTPAPLYNNRELRAFYIGSEMNTYRDVRNSPFKDLFTKLQTYWRFYVGVLLTIPLLAIPALWRSHRSRQLLLMGMGFSLALIPQVWHNPHYAAPATGLIMLLIVLAMRHLRTWQWSNRPVGLYLVRLLPMATCAMFLIRVAIGAPQADSAESESWRWSATGGLARASTLQQLEGSPGKHLVFVRYDLAHDTGNEWVYNSADIDGSRIVWARELDRESNSALMMYFGNRQAWLVEPDTSSRRLIPYDNAPSRPMPFVQIGAPGIGVLRSSTEVKRRVLAQEGADENASLGCDIWNYYFTQATGVEGPNVAGGCFPGDARSEPVTFDHWFAWLLSQR